MRLEMMDQTLGFDNTIEGIHQAVDYVKRTIEETRLHLDYMKIDGNEIYDDFESYLEERVTQVQFIKVELKTKKQMVLSIVESMHEYVQRVIPEINRLNEEFYGNMNKPWDRLIELLQGCEWIIEVVDILKIPGTDYNEIKNYSQLVTLTEALQKQFSELEQAMNNTDMVLIGDILKYEILPIFEEFQISLS
ncbi:hypothetical protein [Paenibacillus thalictri]|uniref:Uncharacterized protein n=1 Tax=Paenibacillus thalictri TaxID=2527873 RepID=A0A4Q9DL09_9BACL|nr:hypothetical protein [Paenibacillus thalictri]TBL72998.1 hypothetical protein EYB31_27615 [Paenibacillus thalictri]